MEESDIFTVNDLSVKWKSKSELYNVLIREGNIYLPSKQDATQYIYVSYHLKRRNILNEAR